MAVVQYLHRFNTLVLLAFISACSSASDRDNAKPARQPELFAIPYTQDWEAYAGDWSSAIGEAVTLTDDTTSPAGASVQKLDRATFGGDYFSPYLPVQGGQTYCVSAKIKWVSGAAPFIGIERSSESGWLGVSWLFGTAYSDTYGRTQAISSTDTEWQTLSRSVVIPAEVTRIRITDELYVGSTKDGPSLAYFDDLAIANGACPPYVQDWETGTVGWQDKTGETPNLVNDDTSTAGSTVQQLDRATFGGDYFSPLKAVVAGEVYCVSANIKWVSGAAPFVGVETFSEGASLGVSWLFGTEYSDAHGVTRAISRTEPGWQNLMRSFVIPTGTTQVRLTDELYVNDSKDGSPLAYIDGLSITEGWCHYADAWKEVAAGHFDTCVLTQYGGVRCWGGENFLGILGDGTTMDRSTPPLNDVLTGVEAIAAGGWFTCALMDYGGVRCWGNNSWGSLGDGTVSGRLTPPSSDVLTGVQAIAAGERHACALMDYGGVRCWGDNMDGQLGDGTTTDRSSPSTIDVLTDIQAIGTGTAHTCALTNGGGVRCWGENSAGQLGNGNLPNSPPSYVALPAGDVLTGVKAIALGAFHTCALMDYGGVRCWGYNYFGQLGDGTMTDRPTPPSTDVLTGVKAIAAGGIQTCALMSYGGVRCWGGNSWGQIGDGTRNNRYLPATSDVLTGAKAIVAGADHTCAIMVSGDLTCWGRNKYGQLGDGTTIDRPSPTEVLLFP